MKDQGTRTLDNIQRGMESVEQVVDRGSEDDREVGAGREHGSGECAAGAEEKATGRDARALEVRLEVLPEVGLIRFGGQS